MTAAGRTPGVAAVYWGSSFARRRRTHRALTELPAGHEGPLARAAHVAAAAQSPCAKAAPGRPLGRGARPRSAGDWRSGVARNRQRRPPGHLVGASSSSGQGNRTVAPGRRGGSPCTSARRASGVRRRVCTATRGDPQGRGGAGPERLGCAVGPRSRRRRHPERRGTAAAGDREHHRRHRSSRAGANAKSLLIGEGEGLPLAELRRLAPLAH